MTVTPVALQDAPVIRPSAAGVTKSWARALDLTARLSADPRRPLAAVLDELGARHGAAPALLSADCTYSFAGLAARARAYTRWAQAQGFGRGDVVALLAPNHPDYFAAWVGIGRTGAVVALLNTNLTDRALAHCLHVAGARAVLLAASLQHAYDSASAYLDERPGVWSMGPQGLDLTGSFDGPLTPEEEEDGATQADRALLIFTSGTTGLPKAANVSHARVLTWCGWFAGMMDATPKDRLYNCLPMYHSVGGVVAVGGVLLNGGSVFVRERFSARAFWDEVVAYDCTLFQYIGELCRFLLNSEPHPLERAHRLRLACGNGLREEVWTAFQARFDIARVLEFYAATEGSFSLYNVEGRPGAIGRVPPFLAHRFPAAIVRYDAETGAPVRDAEGRCQRCGPDEVGEAIGRIATAQEGGANRFEGYTNGAESERKVLRDVFAPGDAWFRTGDLMRRDAAGFFYFVDRVGDTFRWKGENVSTAEVADVLAACPGVTAAAVYGVSLPGCDGRAGMAALATAEGFDLADLTRRVTDALPPYARPVLLRLCQGLEATETFKLKKTVLAQQGFDPAQVGDPLFWLSGGLYLPLCSSLHADIMASHVRV